MTRTLNTLATAVSTVMAMIITIGLIAAANPAQASGKLKIDDLKGGSAEAETSRTGQIKRAEGAVCCAMPRTGKLALATRAECRTVKGRVVNKARCARTKRMPARKFSNLVLKRGVIGKSKPGTPGSLSSGPGQHGGVTCMGGKYYPCWCSGANTCNNFIAACVEVGGDLNCGEHDAQGKPTGCSCYK